MVDEVPVNDILVGDTLVEGYSSRRHSNGGHSSGRFFQEEALLEDFARTIRDAPLKSPNSVKRFPNHSPLIAKVDLKLLSWNLA